MDYTFGILALGALVLGLSSARPFIPGVMLGIFLMTIAWLLRGNC